MRVTFQSQASICYSLCHAARKSRPDRELSVFGARLAHRRSGVVLSAALRFRTGVLDVAGRTEWRAVHGRHARWRRRHATLSRQLQRPRNDVPHSELVVSCNRFRTQAGSVRTRHASHTTVPHRRTARRRAASERGLRTAPGLVESRTAGPAGIESHPFRGIRKPFSAHHRYSPFVSRRPALRAHRTAASGARLGRAGRGTPARPVRAFSARYDALLAAVDQALQVTRRTVQKTL